MTVTLIDFAPGTPRDTRTWDAPAPRLSLREIISARVRSEVAEFNRDRPEVYRGLVAPEESERVLNGYRVKRAREMDPELEVDRALRAFESNGFAVFANRRQITSLDEEIHLDSGPELEFVKLVPLIGG